VGSDWPATLALMSYLVSLVASIDRRLDQITEEIAQLTRDRAALEQSAADAASADGVVDDAASTSTSDAKPAARPPVHPRNGNSARRHPRAARNGARTGSPAARATRRGTRPLGQEELERILGDAKSGLSASTIADQAGAGYQPTLTLLRELEAKGAVRREGSRRSTRWRLLTDEDWIAERTAELERLAASRS
jgi:hypothetical protein